MPVMTASSAKATPKKKKQVVLTLQEEKERTKAVKLPIYQRPGQMPRLMRCNACGNLRKIPGHRKNTRDDCFSKNGISENLLDCVDRGRLATYTRQHDAREWDHSEIFYS